MMSVFDKISLAVEANKSVRNNINIDKYIIQYHDNNVFVVIN